MIIGLGEENSEFKNVKFRLKIDFVLHPACANGLSNRNGSVRDIMVSVVGNGKNDLSSNLYEAVCISCSANTFGKGMGK